MWPQLLALLGVVIGAACSYIVSARVEQSRWRRARAERWDETRLKTYIRYSSTLKEQIRVSQRIGASLGFEHVTDPISPEEGLTLLAEVESRRAAEWESMLLVGQADTIRAARRWHETVWNLELYARGTKTEPDDWRKALQMMSDARDDFYASARQDLGIGGPPPPSGSWPREWQRDELS